MFRKHAEAIVGAIFETIAEGLQAGILGAGILGAEARSRCHVNRQPRVLEEIVYRLFGLTLLAWLGSLIIHDAEGRPPLIVLWIANILVAVVFALAHLPLATALGLPMTPLIVTPTLVNQGLGGLVLGWLYWSRGLESAMVAHAFGNFTVVTVSLIVGAATTWLSVMIGIVVGVAFIAFVLALLRWQPAERSAPADEADSG